MIYTASFFSEKSRYERANEAQLNFKGQESEELSVEVRILSFGIKTSSKRLRNGS